MKTIKILSALLTPIIIICIAFAIVGCEDDPSMSGLDAGGSVPSLSVGDSLAGALNITPDNPQVTHVGQQIEFEVKGGHWPYTWSVGEPVNGSIQVIQNEESGIRFTAAYTVNVVAHNTIIVRDASNREGVEPVTVGSDTAPTFAVSPDTVNLATPTIGTTFDLTALGGTPPYRWFVFSTALGTISSSSGTGVTYTVQSAAMNVKNVVTLTDSGGNNAECEVSHAAASALSITPASITVVSNFTGSIVFTAAGGTSPFTWSIALPDLEDDGVLATAGVGNTTATYQDTAGGVAVGNNPGGTFIGDNKVTVIDSNGKAAEAKITYK